MIFYLDNEDKFHIYYSRSAIIFVYYSQALNKPMKTKTRWVNKNIFSDDHIFGIIEYLKSDKDSDKRIGIGFLEQTLKVKISGEIIGYSDGRKTVV